MGPRRHIWRFRPAGSADASDVDRDAPGDGTPLVPLLRAAGLKEPEALGRFLPFARDVDDGDARELLRG